MKHNRADSFKKLSVDYLCDTPSFLKKENPEYFSKGKRSIILKFGNNKLVKIERNDIGAENRIQNEIKFLKILNKKNIGPKLLKHGKNYFVYELVKGKAILDYLEEKKKDSKNVLKKILLQCRTLDELKINKLEMHKPVKHIWVFRNTPRMIDFERCYYTDHPKNVSQFIQFLTTPQVTQHFPADIKKLRNQAKIYKKEPTKEHFKKLLLLL